jgi:Ca-activated chloride channel family protein
MNNGKNERQSHKITATFTDSRQLVEEKTNATVMMAAIEQLAVEKNELAVALRDEGKITEARQVLLDNATFLAEEAAKYSSNNLEKLKNINTEDAQKLEDDNWTKQRKSMRRQQYKSKTQQAY